jgi:hypothetical protein
MAGDQSRKNGSKGGRPKGFAALEAEKKRDYIARRLSKEFAPIVTTAINQAKKGDPKARDWLTERAYGKSVQPIGNADDTPFKIEISEAIAKKNSIK